MKEFSRLKKLKLPRQGLSPAHDKRAHGGYRMPVLYEFNKKNIENEDMYLQKIISNIFSNTKPSTKDQYIKIIKTYQSLFPSKINDNVNKIII